ncbi:MAG: O-antigen ligase family protein [Clostridia bacterium]|nr:O-antigen ligase family protein [Clostridia bacterium]
MDEKIKLLEIKNRILKKSELVKIVKFFIILFLLKPTGLDAIFPNLNFVMNIFRGISMVLVLGIYLKMVKEKKIEISKVIIIIMLIEGFSILCCLFNKQSCYNVVVYWQGILSLMMLAETEAKNMFQFVKLVTMVLSVYLVINLLYILCNYTTITSNRIFILGKKNMLILYVFPLVFFGLFLNIIKNSKKILWEIVLMLIALFTVSVSSSSTSMFVCAILLIYYVFQNNKMVNKILSHISAKQILLIMIFFFILVIVFNVQKYFSFMIEDVLKKDLTFTGRTYIWEKAIDLILKKPIGYGWEAEIPNVKGILTWIEYSNVGHAHNFILNLAYKSGVIVAFFYCILLWKMATHIDECDNVKLQGFMKIAYVVFLLLTTFEAYPTNCICLLFICYTIINNNLIVKEGEKQE